MAITHETLLIVQSNHLKINIFFYALVLKKKKKRLPFGQNHHLPVTPQNDQLKGKEER